MGERKAIKGDPLILALIGLLVLGALLVVGQRAGVFSIASMGSGASNRVGGKEARALVERGALLVDVRTPAEFAAGHLKGAVNIPVDQVTQRAAELGATDRELVLYCRSGARSGVAARKLAGLGFTAVFDLGSKSAW